MKKTLQFLFLFVTTAAMAQLVPNNISPTGFIHYFPTAKITDHASADGANTFTAGVDANTIQLNYAATTVDEGVKFAPHDLDGAGLAAFVDISNSPKVYVKMKGQIGDNVRINLKNGSTFTFIDGYNFRQAISCSKYRWYEFDFSGSAATMNQISEIEVVYNTGVAGAGSIEIDSLLVGNTGITPTIPAPNSDFSFAANFSNDFFKFGSGPNSIAVTGGILTATIDASAQDFEGVGINVNNGSVNSFIDIANNPVVSISIKGTDGDTIRVNLKNGINDAFVDGFEHNVILDGGSSFKEYIFDFTGAVENIDSIGQVEIIINPTSTGANSFQINNLEVGDPNAEVCGPIPVSGINNEELLDQISVYPNPTTGKISIEGMDQIESVSVFNLQGVLISTVSNTTELEINDQPAGTYIINIATEEGTVQQLITVQ